MPGGSERGRLRHARLHFTTKEVGKGTGLGLAMVHTTVKAHLGRMAIRSEPGEGTRVTMAFPVCGPALPKPVRPPAAHGVVPTPGLKVLLVDDDPLVQHSTRVLLGRLGHLTTSATSGEAALSAVEEGCRPDVVILDMNMPGLGGAGTLPLLQTLRPNLPVILATGRADQAVLDLIRAHPRVSLLPKPFSMAELQSHFDQV